jgi:hypothetical protein
MTTTFDWISSYSHLVAVVASSGAPGQPPLRLPCLAPSLLVLPSKPTEGAAATCIWRKGQRWWERRVWRKERSRRGREEEEEQERLDRSRYQQRGLVAWSTGQVGPAARPDRRRAASGGLGSACRRATEEGPLLNDGRWRRRRRAGPASRG